jgi:hypothetical protein
MLRVAAFLVFLGLALEPAIAQISSTGVPASALSPTLNNRQTPIPAGATSPQPFPFILRPFPQVKPIVPVRSFRSVTVAPLVRPGGIRRRQFGQFGHQVPFFYPVYGVGYDYSAYPSVADPMVGQDPQAASAESDAAVAGSEDALRQAYMQGAHDALIEEQRGRQDARELLASRSGAPAKPKAADDAAKPAEPDNSPSTVFIFKDGRQLETKNYAIMGQTLYDIAGPVVKKVPLADLDKAATIKANDDRGIIVKLP